MAIQLVKRESQIGGCLVIGLLGGRLDSDGSSPPSASKQASARGHLLFGPPITQQSEECKYDGNHIWFD
ncbi:hypothetical protein B2D44_08525 [Lactobacillus hilgardii]